MGNQNDAYDADHSFYARPPAGGLDRVEVVDAGNGAARQPHASASGRRSAWGSDGASARPAETAYQSEASRRTEASGNEVPARQYPDGGTAGGPPADGAQPDPASAVRPRLNPYLCGAWGLVALMLFSGLLWFTGAVEPANYARYMVDPETGRPIDGGSVRAVANLQSMGGVLLIFGLAGAFTLLTLQGTWWTRRAAAGR